MIMSSTSDWLFRIDCIRSNTACWLAICCRARLAVKRVQAVAHAGFSRRESVITLNSGTLSSNRLAGALRL